MHARVTSLWQALSILVVLSMLGLSGCAAPPSPTAVQSPAPTAAPGTAPTTAPPPASGSPRKGGTIVSSIATDPSTLNIAMNSDSNAISVGSKLFNTMMGSDPSFTPSASTGLAQSVETSPDALTYTFRLRPGVKWQDGHDFTCEDVAFTFGEFLPKYNSNGDLYKVIDSITCSGDLTAVFKLKAPFAAMLSVMGQMDGGAVVPKHLLQGTDPAKSEYNQKPVGTGPFMIQEWVRGDHITLVRNPNYFMKGRPFLDKIIYRVIPDAAAVTPAFDAGELDYIQDYRSSKSDLERLAKDPNVQIGYDLEPPKKMTIEFNMVSCKLCMDANVRRAISAAINREEGIKLTRFGLGTPLYSSIAPAYKWAFNKDAQEPKFDLAYANKLLDDAGYKRGPDGTRFSLTLTTTAGDARYVRPSEVIREQLKAVGIDLKLQYYERSALLDQVSAKYNFDIFMLRVPGGGDPAIGLWKRYTCSSIDPKKTNVNNTRYCNPSLDELVKKGETGVTQAERAKAYFEIQTILAQDIPILDLWIDTTTDITRKEYVGNFLVSWPGDSNWDYVWWAKGLPMAEGSYEPVYWLKK